MLRVLSIRQNRSLPANKSTTLKEKFSVSMQVQSHPGRTKTCDDLSEWDESSTAESSRHEQPQDQHDYDNVDEQDFIASNNPHQFILFDCIDVPRPKEKSHKLLRLQKPSVSIVLEDQVLETTLEETKKIDVITTFFPAKEKSRALMTTADSRRPAQVVRRNHPQTYYLYNKNLKGTATRGSNSIQTAVTHMSTLKRTKLLHPSDLERSFTISSTKAASVERKARSGWGKLLVVKFTMTQSCQHGGSLMEEESPSSKSQSRLGRTQRNYGGSLR